MVAKRSTLRKGKWTAEEEEYTQQIIDYFNAGLVPLPEGVTLRAYLAEKLNCDPMRITKKFTGSHCLGKRVYHAAERGETAGGPGAAARAHAHLQQLEARFLNRLERSKDVNFCGLVELDPAFYNHPNIISTPAIDALIQQARFDPHFWADNSGGESEGGEYEEEEDDDDDEESVESPHAAILFPVVPAPQRQHQEAKEEADQEAARRQQQQQQQQQRRRQPSQQHLVELPLSGLESGQPEMVDRFAAGCMSALPSMASMSDMMLLSSGGGVDVSPAAKMRRLEDGHTDGSESGSGSDSEEGPAEPPAMVGQKRPRREEGSCYGYAHFHDVDDGEPERPALLSVSSSASTSSTCSVRTLSAVSQHSHATTADEEGVAESALRMLEVVGGLSKRGSHDDLVAFVCDVNQKQPQQQQMMVHCI